MSKRGKRRNSKRRKSSSSSKQSISPYIFQNQNKSNSVSYKDDLVEKGEKDCLQKENESDNEERYTNSPSKEKTFQQTYHQSSIYTKTTEDGENGVKIVTSVSISNIEHLSPKIMIQQSHEPLSETLPYSATPGTNIMKINCTGSNVKLEIQETVHANTLGNRTTVVFINEKEDSAETCLRDKCKKTCMQSDQSFEPSSQKMTAHNTSAFGNMSDPTETHRSTKRWENPSHCNCCSDPEQLLLNIMMTPHTSNCPVLQNIQHQVQRKQYNKVLSIDQFWDIPPPKEFADRANSLEDLILDLASCRIGPSDKLQDKFHLKSDIHYRKEPLEAAERANLPPSFDQSTGSDNYEPMCMRASLSTNRSSFTKDFIKCQKRKSWIRNNSIATVEHQTCLLPKKRRQTFPRMSEGLGLMQEDLIVPYSESFSSLILCLLHLQTERQGRPQQDNEFGIKNFKSSQFEVDSSLLSEIQGSQDENQSLLSSLYKTSSEDNAEDVFALSQQYRQTRIAYNPTDQHYVNLKCVSKEMENLDTDDCEYKVDPSEKADSGFDQEIGEVDYCSPEPITEKLSRQALAIQVIPPSCSGSEEQILQSDFVTLFQNKRAENAAKEDCVSFAPTSKSSVKTITVGDLEQKFMQMEKHGTALEEQSKAHLHGIDDHSLKSKDLKVEKEPEAMSEKNVNSCFTPPLMTEGRNNLLLNTRERDSEDSNKPTVTECHYVKGSTQRESHKKEQIRKTDQADKHIASRSSAETKEHLKPVINKDPDSSGSDHWAKRRRLFKETKQWSSAEGSSVTSDITEESVSEETRSLDMTSRDNEDGGFYTETFHSSAWIYQGDNISSGAIPPSLNTRTRVVSIRERTVKISKGAGDYPWGFRIQFSKPIVVTEVDTNGAAEEAGLMVGDYVLAVNGTDVTSIPHSEAATLARQGPDILTLTTGSDIARCPNTPRPACRGYLHKRNQSGLIKGWRKRWFVLTHDCCLNYYRHKRDEGKRQALSEVKLEGAEVGQDASLGKPFVFKCRPQAANRVYFFCATSNQEMKRWLEAMEKAIHPVTQNHVWVDVTRHNSYLPPLAVKNPECLGLLHKMNKNKDMWVQYYCILKDGCLYMYSGIRATHAHGGIFLQGYMVREQPYGSKKSTIELKPPSDEFKTFYLCAENPNENKRWLVAIKASIKKWLPLHQALQDYMNQPPEETRM